ncbi:dihydroorotate dehydrogenase [Chelatococcus composti]|jgi:dihydroorotate dehydrogenase (NAD+) catalytic subunit|uniref:Dihydroorotate dehydrogenase n=1 Tax=Chelatococcus composti TaxID=1743235 RepID=A0A841K8K7_9HYPH|nr:dihydroorotate dehydrogenase [Chelatococcus composti]MBB6168430.1 dihydroorotate dehydrogenase (NAD+) catalytic subunit [Chelatococcus composti]MBS7736490.1 dihydroorotate dehydrogenase [Chelatococcus composti]GGG40028.1 dihydroorotate dehydrogenase [Chelatococcus composti]
MVTAASSSAAPVSLGVEVGGLRLQNPVMPASGTFAEGLARVMDLNRLGAFVTKTITREFRAGNPVPRVCETTEGLINSIGIPSKGLDYFRDNVVPFYRAYSPPLVVSISAPTVDGFASMARDLTIPGVAAIEANISCPNIEEDGRSFAMEPRLTEAVTAAMRRATALPLWVKLTPNTGDIVAVARAAEAGGADAVVVANTILAMRIDTETFRPKLGNVLGGLSGPAVKPIALRMVYQCADKLAIPVIGCGGIATAEDAVEFMLAGARAVQVGTTTFVRPMAMIEIIDGLAAFCARRGIADVNALVGAVVDGNAAPEEAEALL